MAKPTTPRDSNDDELSDALVTASLERFVDEDTAADFACMKRDRLLKLTRENKIRSYPISGRLRHHYRYRLSEVAEDIIRLGSQREATIPLAAPVSRRMKFNG